MQRAVGQARPQVPNVPVGEQDEQNGDGRGRNEKGHGSRQNINSVGDDDHV